MSRFIVLYAPDVDTDVFEDPEELLFAAKEFDSDYFVLVDTEMKQVIWADGGEPEDMTLNRSLSGLVSILNKVDKQRRVQQEKAGWELDYNVPNDQ